jgi:hypothetical protein
MNSMSINSLISHIKMSTTREIRYRMRHQQRLKKES